MSYFCWWIAQPADLIILNFNLKFQPFRLHFLGKHFCVFLNKIRSKGMLKFDPKGINFTSSSVFIISRANVNG